MEIRSREVNNRLVLEGALRVYWGVHGVIHLKEDDDQRTVVTVRKRNSCRYGNTLEIRNVCNGNYALSFITYLTAFLNYSLMKSLIKIQNLELIQRRVVLWMVILLIFLCQKA